MPPNSRNFKCMEVLQSYQVESYANFISINYYYGKLFNIAIFGKDNSLFKRVDMDISRD